MGHHVFPCQSLLLSTNIVGLVKIAIAYACMAMNIYVLYFTS